MREFITRLTAYNKHDTGWAKGAPSEDHTTPHRPPGPLGAQLARVAAKHATRDSTKYTARSFRQYHGQRISHAIVMTDALNIYDGILKLKKMVLQRRAA